MSNSSGGFDLWASGSGDETEYSVIASSTGTPGNRQWRIRTQNEIGWGDLSDPQAFVIVGATPVERLYTDGPTWRPTIRWYTANQELAEVIVDDKRYTVFGPDQFFKLPEILPDGEHSVTVRAQNSFGIWSKASTTWEAANPGGASFMATIRETVPGIYNITPAFAAPYDKFIVYRNGVPIASLGRRESYRDYFAVGETEYIVRGISDSNYYDYSSVVTPYIETVTLYNCETYETMELPLSATQTRVINSSKAFGFAAANFAGRRYPVAVNSGYAAASIDVDTAFADRAEAKRLESFAGHLVCVKTEEGDMVIGVLAELRKAADEFIVSYAFTVEQVDFPEVIDIDTGNKL